MTPSAIASTVATRYPRLSRFPIRAWAEWYARTGKNPHWLCRDLIKATRVQVRKRFVLSTGDQLFADPFDHLAAGVRRDGCYEPDVVRLFEKFVERGMVALDIGANIGHHTVVLSRLAGSTGRVCAFEPDPLTFADLRRNVETNHLHNVQLIGTALGAASGEATLYRGAGNMVSSLRPTVHSEGPGSSTVRVQTLDEWCAANQIAAVDLIKIDVEGAELPVLQGGERTLRQYQPAIVTEVSIHTRAFGYQHGDLTAMLRAQGYELFEIGQLPLHPFSETAIGERVFMNVLAVPNGKMQQFARSGVVAPSERRSAS